MTESLIYRSENNRYTPVWGVERVSPSDETPIHHCEKFFPGVSGRVNSIAYKGQSFSIGSDMSTIGPGMEPVVFFSRNTVGKLQIVAIGVTERVDGLLEVQSEPVYGL